MGVPGQGAGVVKWIFQELPIAGYRTGVIVMKGFIIRTEW